MAEITQAPRIEVEVHFKVSEAEARALEALAGYGDDAFIKHFYEHLGQHYMKPHEAGLRLFLKTIRGPISAVLARTDKARKAFSLTPSEETTNG